MREQTASIVSWIVSRVEKAGAKGGVFSLDGKIPSMVTGALCKRALGERILGVMMPDPLDAGAETAAVDAAKQLGIGRATVRLEKPLSFLLEHLPGASTDAVNNLRHRVQMSVLQYFADRMQYLAVINTTYDDHPVSPAPPADSPHSPLHPLCGLCNEQVMQMAELLDVPAELIGKEALVKPIAETSGRESG